MDIDYRDQIKREYQSAISLVCRQMDPLWSHGKAVEEFIKEIDKYGLTCPTDTPLYRVCEYTETIGKDQMFKSVADLCRKIHRHFTGDADREMVPHSEIKQLFIRHPFKVKQQTTRKKHTFHVHRAENDWVPTPEPKPDYTELFSKTIETVKGSISVIEVVKGALIKSVIEIPGKGMVGDEFLLSPDTVEKLIYLLQEWKKSRPKEEI